MFMHGPSTQCSWECVDIRVHVSQADMFSRLTRMTGGSSRPSNEKAAFASVGIVDRPSGVRGERVDTARRATPAWETFTGLGVVCAVI